MDVTSETHNGVAETNGLVTESRQSENTIDWAPVETSPQKRQPLQLVSLESDDEDVEMVDKFILDREGDRSSSGSGTSDSDSDTSCSSEEKKGQKGVSKKAKGSSSSSDSSSEEEEDVKKVAKKTAAKGPSSSSDSSSEEEDAKKDAKKTAAKGPSSSSDSSSEEEEVKEVIKERAADVEAKSSSCTSDVQQTAADAKLKVEVQESLGGPGACWRDSGEASQRPDVPCSAPNVSCAQAIEDSSRSVRQTSLVSYESSSEEEEVKQPEPEPVVVAESAAPKIAPIKAPGELSVEDLPPIEILSLEVSEETELRLIGRISSVVESLIVIQCLPGAPGLEEDSLLFREDRTSIGKVFELFGPVIAPFCSVRFNSAAEAGACAVGTGVYFAPQRSDLSRIVLPARLNTRGSDASWKNDDEPPSQFLDYSDDETERREKRKTRGRPTEEPPGEDAGPSDTSRPRSAAKRRDRRPRPDQPPPSHWPPRPPGPPPGPWCRPPPPHGPQRWPAPPMDLSVPPPGWSGPPVHPVPGNQMGTRSGNQFGTPSGSQMGTPSGSQFGTPPRNHLGTPSGSQFGAPPGSQFGAPPRNHFGPPSGNQSGPPSGNQSGPPSGNVPSATPNPADRSDAGFDHYFDHYYRYYQQYYQQYYQSQS